MGMMECERCKSIACVRKYKGKSSSTNGGTVFMYMCPVCYSNSRGWELMETILPKAPPSLTVIMEAQRKAKRNEIGVRLDLLYGDFLVEMGKIMSVGASKYGENNWRKPGLDGEKSGANHALCHLMEYLEDKPNDYGPRETHLAQVAVNAMFEFYHYRLRKEPLCNIAETKNESF